MVLVEPIKIKALLVHPQRNGRSGAGILQQAHEEWRKIWNVIYYSCFGSENYFPFLKFSSFILQQRRARRKKKAWHRASVWVQPSSFTLLDVWDKFDWRCGLQNGNVYIKTLVLNYDFERKSFEKNGATTERITSRIVKAKNNKKWKSFLLSLTLYGNYSF